jgi:hypothetical protein
LPGIILSKGYHRDKYRNWYSDDPCTKKIEVERGEKKRESLLLLKKSDLESMEKPSIYRTMRVHIPRIASPHARHIRE